MHSCVAIEQINRYSEKKRPSFMFRRASNDKKNLYDPRYLFNMNKVANAAYKSYVKKLFSCNLMNHTTLNDWFNS